MQSAWTFIGAVAALALGFGAGSFRTYHAASGGETTGATTDSAMTFLGGGDSSREKSIDPGRNALGLISYTTYAEAQDRLEELLGALRRLGDYRRYTAPLESERLLDEIEQILSLASEAELVVFLDDRVFQKQAVPDAMDTLAEVAFGCLARLNPARAAEIGLAHWDIPGKSLPGLLSLIREWDQRHPREVERWVENLEDESLRKMAHHVLLTAIAEREPHRALAELRQVDPEMGYGIATVLGETLPLTAMAGAAESLLLKRDDGKDATKLLPPLLAAWGSREPEAMLAWFLSQDLAAIGPEGVRMSLQGLAAADPAGFLKKISPALETQAELRATAGQAWWTWLASEGGEVAAIQWMGENAALTEGFEQSPMLQMHLRRELDPAHIGRSLDALAEVPESPFKTTFSQSFLRSLSQSDPETVLAYAMEHLPVGFRTDETIAGLIGNWAGSGDPEEVIRWSRENLESKNASGSAVRQVLRNWAKKDPKAAADYALSLPKGEGSSAMWGIADEWTQRDPEGLIAYLQGADDAEAVSALTQKSFRNLSDSGRASFYVEKALAMPPGKMRHDAVRGVYGGWANHDAPSAAEAIQKVPGGTLRDAAISGYNNYAALNPKLALDLATRISVPANRDKAIVFRGRAWMKVDAKAAEAAIRANSAIPDSVKAEIFKSAQP